MKQIIYLFVLAIIATSCDDWMDIQPKGKVIPSKAEDYRLLLDATQDIGESAITVTGDLDLWVTDDIDLRDDFIGASYSEYQSKAFMYEDHFYLESEEDEGMQKMYAVNYICNAVISEVLEADGDEAEKQKLYAEAKVHRAFTFLKLVNMYAKQYEPATAATDLGVPMHLEPLLEGSLKRGTVNDVYDLIINDVTEVYDYLPETPEQLWQPSQSSASALLARTYLIMGDFNNALKYADMSLDKKSYLTDYNTLPGHSWYPTLLDFGPRYLNEEQLLRKKPTSDYRMIYPSQEFMDLFDQTNDLRFTGKITFEWSLPGTGLVYYYGYNSGSPYGLTVPEMLLTRAECYARTGEHALAMDDINLLRQNRIATAAYVPLTAASADEALSIVKDERRRELAFMGHRYTDIRRYNAYDNANISIVHTVNGDTYALAPGDNKWALPFARKYIGKNPEIEQNPR
ncbi:RagB/SusD family nutrient uptake outer membrane protein [Carboxylicivirga sp. M1479]|uniref:RagB/SusD family nutrient uptake outer membrane protein n=1 Tax=Carboxylicivirga sp. M1479 TaxID=2594476 RepID=UPI00163DA23F|nr:RagB/SusD family nutrient uptake outer membrane protein [Carboxylicivirga sp. M1479]